MRDTKSVLLLLLSVCLIGTWAFYIYDKTKTTRDGGKVASKDSTVSNKRLNDSVSILYDSTIAELHQLKYGKDSLNNELQLKLQQIDTLRKEISQVLSINNLTREDLNKAMRKIQQLQYKIATLYGPESPQKTNIVSAETTYREPPAISNNMPPLKEGAKTQTGGTTSSTSVVRLKEFQFVAIQKLSDKNAQVTNEANATSYFHISISTTGVTNPGSYLFLVLKDPKGKVIQDDEWLAGVFSSNTEGSIKFTRKVSVDNNSVSLTILPSNVEKGSYKLLIYQNGFQIGKKELQMK